MKLFSVDLSPYCAKVRIVCYAKGLDVEMTSPPGGGPRSLEYERINPLGKIPALLLEDGTLIPESDAIVEYLEDAFPEKSFRPVCIRERALARAVARAADLYVMSVAVPLFGQLKLTARSEEIVDQTLDAVHKGFGALGRLMGDNPYAVGGGFTIADASLAPVLFVVGSLGNALGRGDVVGRHKSIDKYFKRIRDDSRFVPVLREMENQASSFFASH